MLIDTIKDAVMAGLGPVKSATKGWYKRNCMLCHTQGHGADKRARFGVQYNPDSVVVNCFNCGFSSSFKEGHPLKKNFKFFLKQIGVSDAALAQLEFEAYKLQHSISHIQEAESSQDVQVIKEKRMTDLFNNWATISLPEGSLSVLEWLEAGVSDPSLMRVAEYAMSRKLFDLDRLYWTPLSDFHLNDRLILPYYFRGRLVGYTARLAYKAGKDIPKYYQQCPSDFVYNLDPQSDWMRKYLILTEGVLDAYVVDGVSCMGEISKNKVDIINRLQKEVIVCPDRDKKGWDLVKVAIDNDWKVSFPKWERGIKDAAQAAEKYGRLLTAQSIISSAVSGEDRITIMWKLSKYD